MKRIGALIGELLLQHGWIDPAGVERALAEQPHTGMRLCSMLVARGLLDADLGARALGQQFGIPAALQRHLHGRDPALARRLPAELGRTYCAIPIGEGRNGELIICVRDPKPEMLAPLVRAAGSDVIITIAPAKLLEAIVYDTYGPPNEFDVDLSTNPFEVIDPRVVAAAARAESEPGMDLGSMTLVGLDDHRVAKDPSQSGAFHLPTKPPTIPPPMQPAHTPTAPPPSRTMTPAAPPASRTLTPSAPAVARAPTKAPPIVFLDEPLPVEQIEELEQLDDLDAVEQVEPHVPHVRATSSLELDPIVMSIEEVVTALELSRTSDDATELAMSFVEERWLSSLLLVIMDGAAHGQRGHGPGLTTEAIHAMVVPLTSESIIREAHDLRRFVTEVPSEGVIQDRLLRLLGHPVKPCAIPLIVGGHVACVLVVGDPVDAEDSAADLSRLGAALASAFQRIVRETRR